MALLPSIFGAVSTTKSISDTLSSNKKKKKDPMQSVADVTQKVANNAVKNLFATPPEQQAPDKVTLKDAKGKTAYNNKVDYQSKIDLVKKTDPNNLSLLNQLEASRNAKIKGEKLKQYKTTGKYQTNPIEGFVSGIFGGTGSALSMLHGVTSASNPRLAQNERFGRTLNELAETNKQINSQVQNPLQREALKRQAFQQKMKENSKKTSYADNFVAGIEQGADTWDRLKPSAVRRWDAGMQNAGPMTQAASFIGGMIPMTAASLIDPAAGVVVGAMGAYSDSALQAKSKGATNNKAMLEGGLAALPYALFPVAGKVLGPVTGKIGNATAEKVANLISGSAAEKASSRAMNIGLNAIKSGVQGTITGGTVGAVSGAVKGAVHGDDVVTTLKGMLNEAGSMAAFGGVTGTISGAKMGNKIYNYLDGVYQNYAEPVGGRMVLAKDIMSKTEFMDYFMQRVRRSNIGVAAGAADGGGQENVTPKLLSNGKQSTDFETKSGGTITATDDVISRVKNLVAQGKPIERKMVVDYAINNYPQRVIIQDTGLVVNFSGNGIRKTALQLNDAKTASMYYLPELLQTAKYQEAMPDVKNRNDIKQYSYYSNKFNYDNKDYDVLIRIRELKNDENKFYHHSVNDEDVQITLREIKKRNAARAYAPQGEPIGNAIDTTSLIRSEQGLSQVPTSSLHNLSETQHNQLQSSDTALTENLVSINYNIPNSKEYVNNSENVVDTVQKAVERKNAIKEGLQQVYNEFPQKYGQVGNQERLFYDIIKEYRLTGELNNKKLDVLYENIYDTALVNTEESERIKQAKRDIKNTKFDLAKDDRAELVHNLGINWYNQVKYKMGLKTKADTAGVPVDSYYQQLNEVYPDLFPADIAAKQDQLMKMLEVTDMETNFFAKDKYSEEDKALAKERLAQIILNTANKIGTVYNTNILGNNQDIMLDVDQMRAINGKVGLGDGAFQTLATANDKAAINNPELRKALYNETEIPHAIAQKEYAFNLRKVKADYWQKMKEMGIKKGSDEDAASMWIAEGMRPVGIDENGGVITVPYTMAELKTNFPDNWEKIAEFARYNRGLYDNYAKDLQTMFGNIYNRRISEIESMTKGLTAEIEMLNHRIKTGQLFTKEQKNLAQNLNGLMQQVESLTTEKAQLDREYQTTQLKYRKDYIHHMPKQTKVNFGGIADFFMQKDININPELVGITGTTKPKKAFWSAMLKRGKGTYEESAIASFLDYIEGAEYQKAYTPLISKTRNLISTLQRETTGKANGYIAFLQNWANNLAKKTGEVDRKIKGETDRKAFALIKKVNGRVAANKLMWNLSSGLSQIYNVPALANEVKNPATWVKGLINYVRTINPNSEASIASQQSGFMSERFLDDSNFKFETGLGKYFKKGGMEVLTLLDRVGTQFIWQTAYSDGQTKRLTGDDLILHADDITRRSVAGRGHGEVPVFLQNDVVKLFMPFQVEVNKDYQIFKNNIKSIFGKGTKSPAAGLTALAGTMIVSALLNGIIGKIAPGKQGSMDIIHAILDGVQAGDDNDTILTKIGKITGSVAGNIFANAPGGSIVANFIKSNSNISDTTWENIFGSNDPSRFGTGQLGASALLTPIISTAKDLSSGEGWGSLNNLWNYAYDFGLPYGGTQVRRSVQGLQDLGVLSKYNKTLKDTSGNVLQPSSYGTQEFPANYDVSGKLRFALDSTADKVKDVLLGAFSTKAGQDYLNSGGKPLTPQQTINVQDLFHRGLQPSAAITDIGIVTKLGTVKDEYGNEVKTTKEVVQDYLTNSGLTSNQAQYIWEKLKGYDGDYTQDLKQTKAGQAKSAGVDMAKFNEFKNSSIYGGKKTEISSYLLEQDMSEDDKWWFFMNASTPAKIDKAAQEKGVSIDKWLAYRASGAKVPTSSNKQISILNSLLKGGSVSTTSSSSNGSKKSSSSSSGNSTKRTVYPTISNPKPKTKTTKKPLTVKFK